MDRADLPLDIKLMTLATRGLVMVFAVLCLGAIGTWIARHPAWNLRGISVHGEVSHQNAVGLRAHGDRLPRLRSHHIDHLPGTGAGHPVLRARTYARS